MVWGRLKWCAFYVNELSCLEFVFFDPQLLRFFGLSVAATWTQGWSGVEKWQDMQLKPLMWVLLNLMGTVKLYFKISNKADCERSLQQWSVAFDFLSAGVTVPRPQTHTSQRFPSACSNHSWRWGRKAERGLQIEGTLMRQDNRCILQLPLLAHGSFCIPPASLRE